MLACDLETKQKLAPFLRHPVLRRVIQTFTNDEDGNIGRSVPSSKRSSNVVNAAQEGGRWEVGIGVKVGGFCLKGEQTQIEGG